MHVYEALKQMLASKKKPARILADIIKKTI